MRALLSSLSIQRGGDTLEARQSLRATIAERDLQALEQAAGFSLPLGFPTAHVVSWQNNTRPKEGDARHVRSAGSARGTRPSCVQSSWALYAELAVFGGGGTSMPMRLST